MVVTPGQQKSSFRQSSTQITGVSGCSILGAILRILLTVYAHHPSTAEKRRNTRKTTLMRPRETGQPLLPTGTRIGPGECTRDTDETKPTTPSSTQHRCRCQCRRWSTAASLDDAHPRSELLCAATRVFERACSIRQQLSGRNQCERG